MDIFRPVVSKQAFTLKKFVFHWHSHVVRWLDVVLTGTCVIVLCPDKWSEPGWLIGVQLWPVWSYFAQTDEVNQGDSLECDWPVWLYFARTNEVNQDDSLECGLCDCQICLVYAIDVENYTFEAQTTHLRLHYTNYTNDFVSAMR